VVYQGLSDFNQTIPVFGRPSTEVIILSPKEKGLVEEPHGREHFRFHKPAKSSGMLDLLRQTVSCIDATVSVGGTSKNGSLEFLIRDYDAGFRHFVCHAQHGVYCAAFDYGVVVQKQNMNGVRRKSRSDSYVHALREA
jgi:hypothetical protein